MPRTKHAFIGLLALLTMFVGAAISFFVPDMPHGVPISVPEQANVLDALPTQPDVVVVKNTSREEARALLHERLKAFVNDSGPEDTREDSKEPAVSVEEEQSPAQGDETPAPPKSIRCDPGAAPGAGENWGPVNVTFAEGARVIRSLATGPDGLSLHTLELPASPVLTGMTACLPNRPILIMLDGTAVMPGERVATDREGILGYAIDGFPLFGPYEDGNIIVSGDLDICHGHTHTIIDQGVPVTMYHYHATEDEPYTLGCLRGSPVIK